MKKIFYSSLLALAICTLLAAATIPPQNDCNKDITDTRGKMKPWEKGAWETGKYRNVFRDAGYKKAAIDAKLAKAYYDVFEGPNRVYFEVGDSMAYVSDLKNHDARTEGLSYGLMVAVQLNKKDVFDRLWRWTRKYMQHQGGPRDAYFAWSVNPGTGRHNSEGSASDGELYFVTDLLFASNRWGNNTGIDYYAEARRILDAMWSKDGTNGQMNVINVEHKQITFVPDKSGLTGLTLHIISLHFLKSGLNMLMTAENNSTGIVPIRPGHSCTEHAILLPDLIMIILNLAVLQKPGVVWDPPSVMIPGESP
jgi:oligosaccharide reducing-end xylanase